MRTILVFLTIILIGCKNEKKVQYANTPSEITVVDSIEPLGKALMETKCFVCHGASKSAKDRIAPPMVAIKAFYINSTTTKEEFTNALLSFTQSPSEEKVKLKSAFKRFGVMPYQAFAEEDIRNIASYMYDYQIEEPKWFKSHFEEKHGVGNFHQTGKKLGAIDKEYKTYEEIGLEYALNTKKALGKNLMSKIQKEGTLAALEFCTINALSITDSMSTVHNAKIKRVTDKPRNPNNQATSLELEHIKKYKKIVEQGLEVKPVVSKNNKKIQFYYPITTNAMCLQCHGSPNSDIKPQVLTSLYELYPKDMAKGYSVNEVRGIWSIEFDK